MAISWDSFDKIWASTSPLTPYEFSDQNYSQGWNFVGSTPPARQMWDSIQKTNDEKFKYLRDNFGTPNIVTQASQMTDTDKVYVYLGSEAGWNSGHWYYYDEGTSSWADGGVYNSVAFVTDTTLSIAGQPADAKATGDALALKSDLAGCTFTGNVSVNADLSVTGDATIGTDLSVTGVSTLTGNVSAGADVTVVGDVSSANLTTSADATIGGNLSVTGTSTLAGNITTSGDVSADNISATTNATVGGNLSVTGTSTLTGDINAGADIVAVGDVSADNLTTTTNATVGGSLSVAGTSTLTGNVTTNGNISAVGDISSANLTTTNATIGGNATVTGDVSCANLTTSADASVGVDLTVTGDSTLADTTVNNLVVNNDLSVAGDSSLTNLSVSGTTALAGTSTAPTPSADDNSTKIATTEYVQTEIKPIEVNADIVNKRVTNIEKLLQGNLYDYQTDSNSAYTKTVPAGAMPYASLDSVGGKTLAWNQLANTCNQGSGSVQVVSDGNGVFHINGTTTAVQNHKLSSATSINGHKYYVSMSASATLNDNDIFVYNDNHGVKINNVDSVIQTATADGNFFIRLNSGVTFTNVTITVQIHDITLMFGSGNEPTTVAEFTAQFPASYYSYNAGTLLSAGVTEVVSNGKNLLPNTLPSNTINATIASGGAINSATNARVFAIPCEPNTDYMLSQKVTPSAWGRVGFANVLPAIGNTIDDKGSMANRLTFSTNSGNNHYMIMQFSSEADFISNVNSNEPMIEVGTAKTNYAPYKAPISYPIPAEIQALEGYGWSAGTAYNYIDFERKVYVQNVGSIDMGQQTYTLTGGGNFRLAINDFYTPTQVEQSCILPRYTWISTSNVDKCYWNNMTGGVGYLFARDESIADADAFKTSMNGIHMFYRLAEPVETDISAYLTDDNLISVESGGTLTFPNSNGTDYQIPVPSAETYMVDLQSALGE